MTPALHIIPCGGDEPVHWAHGGCWCFPTKHEEEFSVCASLVLMHNAKDARERYERQGLVLEGLSWQTIGGVE